MLFSLLQIKEARVNLGLQKLRDGASDVEHMKTILAAEQDKLAIATRETNAMLQSLELSSAEAEKEANRVAHIRTACLAEAAAVEAERDDCRADLAGAQPYLDAANEALASVQPSHIVEMRTLKKPSDIIRVVFDQVLLLLHRPTNPVTGVMLMVNKHDVPFLAPSWQQALYMMVDTSFLRHVQLFEKDKINEETVELLQVGMGTETGVSIGLNC